ncbi:MAG: hypothetical protein AB7I50_09815 [Vicinamibacterales bacterium]
MTTKLLAVVAVGLAAVVAAGSGAYLAVRQNRSEQPAAQQAAVAPTAVSETEAVVGSEGEAAGVSASTSPQGEAKAEVAPRLAPSRAVAAVRPAPRARAASPSSDTRTQPGPPASAPSRTEPPVVAVNERPVEPVAPPIEATAPAPVVSAVPEVVPLPPVPQFEDVVVPADAVVGLQVENSVSSETARIEDRVDARVTRDVRAAGAVAIPAGSRVQGSVTLVERGGKVRERARLGVRFHTVVLADGTRVPIRTDTIFREGESPTNGSASKIGGAAVGGAIIGAILGGGKGAAIGGSVGAAGGTAAVMAGSRKPAVLNAGTTVTVHLTESATVTIEK